MFNIENAIAIYTRYILYIEHNGVAAERSIRIAWPYSRDARSTWDALSVVSASGRWGLPRDAWLRSMRGHLNVEAPSTMQPTNS